jgi:hypothetical protein
VTTSDEWIKKALAEAPPIADWQKARLARLLTVEAMQRKSAHPPVAGGRALGPTGSGPPDQPQ